MDAHEDPDQGKISQGLVERVLACGTGPGGNLTLKDLSRLLGQRRVESKRTNPSYSQAFAHKLFGSSKCVPRTFFAPGRSTHTTLPPSALSQLVNAPHDLRRARG